MGKMDQVKIKTRWQNVKINGYPPHDSDPYYTERYSVPILPGNEFTGGVDVVAYRWDYLHEGWVYASLVDGDNPCDYEVQCVTHWALWPNCKLANLD